MMLRVTFCLKRLPGMTRAQFQDYWRNSHAPLVKEHAEALGIRKYVQSHSLALPGAFPLAEATRRQAEAHMASANPVTATG